MGNLQRPVHRERAPGHPHVPHPKQRPDREPRAPTRAGGDRHAGQDPVPRRCARAHRGRQAREHPRALHGALPQADPRRDGQGADGRRERAAEQPAGSPHVRRDGVLHHAAGSRGPRERVQRRPGQQGVRVPRVWPLPRAGGGLHRAHPRRRPAERAQHRAPERERVPHPVPAALVRPGVRHECARVPPHHRAHTPDPRAYPVARPPNHQRPAVQPPGLGLGGPQRPCDRQAAALRAGRRRDGQRRGGARPRRA